ncbi:MAG: double-strand break repair helicase AddA [Sphingomonadaceae bacterium]|nr:double-strand break repair helicase AddA [Sphingomonadaceae bacterium]
MSGGKNKGRVFPLKGNQLPAVDPQDNVWLSASAGTGKTQVLSARVLRLLLREDVAPEQLLCLTFTKAGAAEMAVRVSEVLANWVRMEDTLLGNDLLALGADNHPDTRERARSLFARVLDCPGGGLRIDTIHAFSQWLLAAFPTEAGLTPGTRPMEDRDRDLLAHEVLADLLTEWDGQGGAGHTAAIESLSVRLGPDGVRKWLMRCAEARDMWFGPGGWQEGDIPGRVRTVLGLDAKATAGDFAPACADGMPGVDAVRRVMWVYDQWGTANGKKYAGAIGEWLLGTPEERFTGVGALLDVLFNDEGKLKYQNNLEKKLDGVPALADAAREWLEARVAEATLLDLVDYLVPALTVGRRFALAWDEAKKRAGLIDFDDQIARAAQLLASPDLGPWIRFKLDRQFDHILIDEAQDTNAEQWSIIKALTDDFFSGEGQRAGKQRTIFVVGDYKQAIFGFQGTSPENFEAARTEFARLIGDAADNANALRPKREWKHLQDLGLGRSYRTSQPVLDFVDAAISAIGPAQFGLRQDAEPHTGFDRPGQVVIWPALAASADDPEQDDDSETDSADWLPEPERRMADRIADQVKHWLEHGYALVKDPDKPRNAGPGDIMVLVRKRRELAGLIVARLYAKGVPVAGVDRLRLGAPLPVKDLMAALRFAAQPLDDLSLANLLVSPLVGWSQEQLLEHGWRPPGNGLWEHVRRSDHPEVMATAEQLRELLRRADTDLPQALLHWILTGPWSGRRRLVARLGSEANDPIDELLNAASAYAANHTASLAGFIRWFDSGEGELKREAGASEGLVRVMTVHGSKGLQAPIVILADATGNPDKSLPRDLSLDEGERAVPLPTVRKAERVGPVGAAHEAAKRAEREEHWRLLYVAMTRAEEALFIGGALGKKEKEPAADSWYARLAALPGGEEMADEIWGLCQRFGVPPQPVARDGEQAPEEVAAMPDWALRPVGDEPRPPRPLAPSALGQDPGAEPPLPSDALAAAARRGGLIHRLLERLPDVPPEERAGQARQWLARTASELEEGAREEILQAALGVVARSGFADLFGPDALAEVPLAATVGGQVIAGVADRLLVTPEEVTVVDFKTARRPPASLQAVPESVRKQMAAYAAVLEQIYPGRTVRAALLYTQTPQIIELPQEELARYKGALSTAQESFDPLLLE